MRGRERLSTAVALLLAALVAGTCAQQHVIVITGNTTRGTWAVDGEAPEDLELIIGAQYRFDVQGEGIDKFFVALDNTTQLRTYSCGPSPCYFDAEFTPADALLALIYGIYDDTLSKDLTLSGCNALADADECGEYDELCSWCQSSLVCQDVVSSCTECSAVPLATCGDPTTSPGCMNCSSTGVCTSTTQTCPLCGLSCRPPPFFKKFSQKKSSPTTSSTLVFMVLIRMGG